MTDTTRDERRTKQKLAFYNAILKIGECETAQQAWWAAEEIVSACLDPGQPEIATLDWIHPKLVERAKRACPAEPEPNPETLAGAVKAGASLSQFIERANATNERLVDQNARLLDQVAALQANPPKFIMGADVAVDGAGTAVLGYRDADGGFHVIDIKHQTSRIGELVIERDEARAEVERLEACMETSADMQALARREITRLIERVQQLETADRQGDSR